MPNLFRKLFTPSLRDQLEAGVRAALRRYVEREIPPRLQVYVSVDLLPDGLDAEAWRQDETAHLEAFAAQWAQDNAVPRAGLEVEVVILDTKREFAFVKTLGLDEPDAGAHGPAKPPGAGTVLEVLESPALHEPVRLQGETILGRRPGPGVTETGDRYMSARHARLRPVPGGVEVTDLDSKNRTFLNDEPLPPHQPRLAQEGDVLRLGGTLLRVAGPG